MRLKPRSQIAEVGRRCPAFSARRGRLELAAVAPNWASGFGVDNHNGYDRPSSA